MTKIEGLKVIYFGDYMLSGINETIQEEFENEVLPKFQREGVDFDKVDSTESPVTSKDKFDILMFDWGGASVGNSFMESYLRQIIKMADANPSRIFIMVSSMTEWAMRDAKEDSGLNLPNVFLSIHTFCEYWKGLNNG